MKKYHRKIIPLEIKDDSERMKKISLSRCRELLGKKAVAYSDEQVLLIRDRFYELAAIAYDEETAKQETTIIPITVQRKDNNNEERNHLRAG